MVNGALDEGQINSLSMLRGAYLPEVVDRYHPHYQTEKLNTPYLSATFVPTNLCKLW